MHGFFLLIRAEQHILFYWHMPTIFLNLYPTWIEQTRALTNDQHDYLRRYNSFRFYLFIIWNIQRNMKNSEHSGTGIVIEINNTTLLLFLKKGTFKTFLNMFS